MANIVETAIAEGSFKTLGMAIKATGLAETLSGAGPFTVFAPDDEAFAKMPKVDAEGLLKDIPTLRRLISYHVVADKVMVAEVSKLPSAKTLEGQKVGIAYNNVVKINGANVTKADIECDNGVIHTIDAVLVLPDTNPLAG